MIVTRTKQERFNFLEEEAATYDEMEEPYLQQAERFRKRTIELAGNFSGRILEIGCATGRLTAKLPRQMRLLVCLDVSISKLRLAAKRTGGWPRFVKADMEHLPFKPLAFDLVLSHYALHHAFNPKKAVLESIEVARDGARLFYAVPRASDHPAERRERVKTVRRGEGLRAFRQSQFKRMIAGKARLAQFLSEDFTSHVWAGRVLFLDCIKEVARIA